MKKLFCLILVTFLTACSCSNNSENNTDKTTDLGTEVGATEIATTSDANETTTALPEGMAYKLDNGTYISIDSLITPMNKLNNICQGISDNVSFLGIYPTDVINKLAEFNGAKNPAEYANFMYERYVQMYGEDFSIQNDYVSCSPLSENELEDMISFYNEYFFTEITPKYGFVVESNFKVSYTDEEGNVQEDTSSDFYIAYYMNNVIYIDYFYVDTLDL